MFQSLWLQLCNEAAFLAADHGCGNHLTAALFYGSAVSDNVDSLLAADELPDTI